MEAGRARCVENAPLAQYILDQREALLAKEGYRENLDTTLSKAYRNVCDCDRPICSLRDASQIKGIGQWILKMLKGFFPEPIPVSQEATEKPTSKKKVKRRYLPQRNSAPYAILITLYKAQQQGRSYMKKQELIDAADESGLSQMLIQPSNRAGPSTQFGYTTKDWYSGWSSMKTLIAKALVVKSSCPAKYKLTEEGESIAEECLKRSSAQAPNTFNIRPCSSGAPSVTMDEGSETLLTEEYVEISADEEVAMREERSMVKKRHSARKSAHQSRDFANEGAITKHIPPPSALAAEYNGSLCIEECADSSSDDDKAEDTIQLDLVKPYKPSEFCRPYTVESFVKDASTQLGAPHLDGGRVGSAPGLLHLPPLSSGERFLDSYSVVLILDDREQFLNTGKGNIREKFAKQIKSEFEVEIEVRHLPVGDALWIARHKDSGEEYVLDFIVERKNVKDLLSSIKDTRYKQQKLRLMRCGLRKLIYVVEGDPNVLDSAESIKTACLTTEIVEGFDVQRTRDVRDTLRKYGHLTCAVSAYYNELSDCKLPRQGLCKIYRKFVDDCKDLDRERVRDVFGVMLMQIKHVTENIALTILEKYPTPFSLITAYLKLKGDEKAQENLLTGLPIISQQNKEISSTVSKRVFQFCCSPNLK